MGVKNWYRVFGDSAVSRTKKYFTGKRIGVDVSYEIYRASLGMQSIGALTDKDGNPTVLLNVLLCNIIKYKKEGAKGLIYVFDNPNPNKLKLNEQAKRTTAKQKAEAELKDASNRDQLEKRTFSITGQMIKDVKMLLDLMGVAWIVAPDQFEAEHMGAKLTNVGIIDTFVTSDSDAMMFGCKSMLRKKGSKYEEYTLKKVLKDAELTREQFVTCGVVLGCDFAEKTKGIGVKTVLKKGPDVELTDEQLAAKEYFLSECPFDKKMIHRGKKDLDKVVEWLVSKNFSKERVEKLLVRF